MAKKSLSLQEPDLETRGKVNETQNLNVSVEGSCTSLFSSSHHVSNAQQGHRKDYQKVLQMKVMPVRI